MGELLVILAIALLVFGAGKLPQVGSSLGKAIRDFKKATSEDDEEPQPARAAPQAEALPPPSPAAQPATKTDEAAKS